MSNKLVSTASARARAPASAAGFSAPEESAARGRFGPTMRVIRWRRDNGGRRDVRRALPTALAAGEKKRERLLRGASSLRAAVVAAEELLAAARVGGLALLVRLDHHEVDDLLERAPPLLDLLDRRVERLVAVEPRERLVDRLVGGLLLVGGKLGRERLLAKRVAR